MKTVSRLLCLCAWLGVNFLSAAESSPAPAIVPVPETPAQHEARLAWWREARFGIFIHWGLYAIPGRGEWVQWSEQIPNEEYARLADQFRPAQFDASAWAATIKAAGAKYAVLTARHHDGFALFDDPQSEFTSVKTAAHRDFVSFVQDEHRLELTVPAGAGNVIDTIIKLEPDRNIAGIAPLKVWDR
jgi:hypothetical protein